MGICFLLGIIDVSPSIVISIAGSVTGYFIIYIIPIAIHLACIYRNEVFFAKYIPYGKILCNNLPSHEEKDIYNAPSPAVYNKK